MPDLPAAQACIIHSARHPADAALSAFQQSFFPNKVPWSFDLKSESPAGTSLAACMGVLGE